MIAIWDEFDESNSKREEEKQNMCVMESSKTKEVFIYDLCPLCLKMEKEFTIS